MIRAELKEQQAQANDRRARIRRLYLSLAILWLVGLGVFYMITVGRALPSGWPASLKSTVSADRQALLGRSAVGMTALVLVAGVVARFALSARARHEPRRPMPAALHWLLTLLFGIGSVLFLAAGLPAITDPGDVYSSAEVHSRQTDDVCLALICGAGAVASAITAIRRAG